jgi:hypothetical protein
MVFRTRNIWKVVIIGKFVLQFTDNIPQRGRLRSKNDRVTHAFDDYLTAFESKSLGQAHRLAATVLEKLGRCHIYSVYLHWQTSSEEKFCASRPYSVFT